MNYLHRNGEIEPPTAEGWYWFNGDEDGIARRDLVKVNLPDRAFPTLTISPVWVDGWMTATELRGRWWGPIETPWT